MRARGPVGYTCPKIDSVISCIEGADHAAKALADCIGELMDMARGSGELETIRSHNDALREWGAEQEDRANAQEALAEALAEELVDTRDELTQALARIAELEAL